MRKVGSALEICYSRWCYTVGWIEESIMRAARLRCDHLFLAVDLRWITKLCVLTKWCTGVDALDCSIRDSDEMVFIDPS